MECIKNPRNKFHIDDAQAANTLSEIFDDLGIASVSVSDTRRAELKTLYKKRSNPFTALIVCALACLSLAIVSPLLLFIGGKSHAVSRERRQNAEAMANANTYDVSALQKGTRDNTPHCLVPMADGKVVYSNDVAVIDASNTSEGYIVAKYTGQSAKVKLRITGPDEITYTYNMTTEGGREEVFPLQAGNGSYLVAVFENLAATQYVTAFSETIDVNIRDEFLPFLYPNQYVDFTENDQAIAYCEYLSYTANTDLDVVSAVYNALITSMSYDYEEAETVQSGYIPDIDEVLTTGKGICLDYAALMTSMLRSQNIPTRMEIGYAGQAYHAWLSTYIKDIGWVNGMIQFDGHEWSLMDPTFASTTDTEKLANFIGDGENYQTKYIY